VAHLRGFLSRRPDHESRRVAQRDDRKVVRVAQRHEARCFVGTVAVDGSTQPARVIRKNSNRLSFDPSESRDYRSSEFRSKLGNRVRIR
jgi:hypothetical protein